MWVQGLEPRTRHQVLLPSSCSCWKLRAVPDQQEAAMTHKVAALPSVVEHVPVSHMTASRGPVLSRDSKAGSETRDRGSSIRDQGFGFRDRGSGITDQGPGIWVQGLGIRDQGSGFGDQQQRI